MKRLSRALIWALRIPAFASAMGVYFFAVAIAAIIIHGRRAPATFLAVLLRSARVFLALPRAGRRDG